jgi:hypothetical protein
VPITTQASTAKIEVRMIKSDMSKFEKSINSPPFQTKVELLYPWAGKLFRAIRQPHKPLFFDPASGYRTGLIDIQ